MPDKLASGCEITKIAKPHKISFMAQLIDDLLAYFDAHVDELLGKYEGKVVLISKDKEVSAFDDFKTGYDSGIKNYGYGNFLLKECSRAAINAVHVINPIVAVV